MRNKLAAIVGSVMSAIIALLGFSSCSEPEPEPVPDMYGSPYATFKVSGNLTDEIGELVGSANDCYVGETTEQIDFRLKEADKE